MRIVGDHIQLGGGGALAPTLPLSPVPLERAGTLAESIAPRHVAPWTATVRWVGMRTAAVSRPTGRIELIAGGSLSDVTSDFQSLRPGEAKLFSRNVRVGPEPTLVRLRLALDPLPPVPFFESLYEADTRGLAIDVGGGDRAFRTVPVLSQLDRIGPSLTVEGNHVANGYTVIVLSGAEWRHHDLSQLLERQGQLELRFAGADARFWTVRLVGDGVQTQAISLSQFSMSVAGGVTRYTLPLKSFGWDKVPSSEVVGIAFAYSGPAGPLVFRLMQAMAITPEAPATGLAIASIAELNPDARPARAWFTVGTESGERYLYSHLFVARLAAVILAVLALMGGRAAWQILRTRPVAVSLALLTGPVLRSTSRRRISRSTQSGWTGASM